jgi:PAS domain S-box-containing protein
VRRKETLARDRKFSDITERKGREFESARLAAIVEGSDDSIISTDLNAIITSWNRGAELFSGYSAEEAIGRHISFLLPPDLRDEFVGTIREKIEKGEVVRGIESRRLRKDGRVIEVSLTVSPIRDGHGKVVGTSSIIRDITELKQAQEALSRSERKYRGVVEQSLVRIGISKGKQVVFANAALLRIFGYDSLEEFARIPLLDHVAPTSRKYIETLMTKTDRGEQASTEIEYDIICKDGKTKTLRATTRRITADSETYTETVFQDITERKRAEVAVKESEERFRKAFSLSPDACYISTWEGINVEVNEAFVKIFGYTSEECAGRSSLDLNLYAHGLPDRARVLNELRSRGRFNNLELEGRRKNGEIFPVLFSASILKLGDQQLIMGVIRDLTEQKRMEAEIKRYSEHLEQLVKERTEELQSAKKRLEYVVSLNPAMIFVAKPLPDLSDYSMTYISKRVATSAGYESDELIGEEGYEFWASRVHPDDLASYRAGVPSFWREGHRVCEYRFRHKEGAYRWLHEEARLIRDANGKPLEIIGYTADVTPMKEMEQRLKEAEHLAGIGEAATMVGHDLRNPLQAIISAVHVLRHDPLPTNERKEMLELIQKCVDYSDGIVNDLLDYTRKFELTKVSATPKSLIRSTLDAIRVPDKIGVQDHTQDQPTITLDQDKMKRAIVNLVENAIDAMPNGGTLAFGSKDSGEYGEITISDTGKGLPRDVIEHPWKPLQTTKAKGMGYGLAIVKRIIDAHNGTITIESEQDQGTTVTIKLPSKPTP